MRIGIDCRTILNPDGGEKAGIGYYTYNLATRLIQTHPEDEFVLFLDNTVKNPAKELIAPNSRVHYLKLSAYKKFLPFIYSHLLVGQAANEEKLDIYHGPANVIPLGFRGKSVLTIHDLAIYKHPEFFPSGQSFSKNFVVPKSVSAADRVLPISGQTKKDLQELFQTPEEKIRTIPLGVDLVKFHPVEDRDLVFREIASRYQIPRPYVLYIGTLQPRKNLVRLVEAFYQLKQRNPDLVRDRALVLAGATGWLYEEIFEEVRNRGLERDVIFPGYVDDVDLPKMIQAAEVFAYPSLYEGFGLPVLEAMACGTPVLTSEISSMPEVGGIAPRYVNPYEVSDICDGLEILLTDKEEQARQRRLGPEQAQKFTWAHTVEATHQVYKELMK